MDTVTSPQIGVKTFDAPDRIKSQPQFYYRHQRRTGSRRTRGDWFGEHHPTGK